MNRSTLNKPARVKVRHFFEGDEIQPDEFERIRLNGNFKYPSEEQIRKKSASVASKTKPGMISFIDVDETGMVHTTYNIKY